MVDDAVLRAFVEAKGVREATREIAKVQEALREAKRDADQATAAVNRFGRVRGIAVLDVDAAKARAATAAAAKEVNGFDKANGTAVLDADAAKAKAQTAQAQKSLNGFDATKATADLRADAAQVQKATGTATRDVAKFDSLTSTAKLDVDASKLGAVNGEVRQSRREFLGLGRSMEDTGERGSRALGGLRTAAGLLGGVAIGAGLARGFRAATDEFEEARKVGALTEQVIKTTGGSANVTARQVEALAGSISKKVGIDDEAIQSASNLLLTFKNVRNETGKGRDVFNQATKAAVDLSAAGFGSLDSTSKQLGKALNDPVKGMTALGRAGVTFSEDQKKAIEALMKTGRESDRLRAQQIILKEVQSQVGGAAAAQATPLDKLRVTMGNLAEAAGTVLVPMLDKGAKVLTKLLDGMMNSTGAGGAIVDVFKTVGSTVGATVATIRDIVNWFREHKTVTMALAGAMSVLIAAFVAFKVQAAIQALLAGMAGAFWALNAAMSANPIGLVVIAIAALVAGLIVAYRESETFRAIVDGAFKAVAATAGWLWGAIKTIFTAIADAIKWAWQQITGDSDASWRDIGTALTLAFAQIKANVVATWNFVRDNIVTPLRDAFNWVKTAVVDVAGFLAARWENIKSAASTAWNIVRDYVITPIREAVSWVKTAISDIGGFLSARWENLKSAASTAWNAIRDNILTPIRSARDAVGDVIEGIWNRFKTGFGRIIEGALAFAGTIKEALGDAFRGAANIAIGFINAIIKAINIIPGVNIGLIDKIKEETGKGKGGPNGTGKLATGGTFDRSGAHQAFAHGGAFARTGGFVNAPITLMGEEAPRGHPEWVIPTNPAYRSRALGLWQQAGASIGAYAQGGSYSVGDMAKLASAVDAPNPRLMGAIGMAESGGNPHAVGPSTSGGRARGLWQIMWPLHARSFPGMDPFAAGDNARMMRSILASQGLGAWEAYTNGAYKQFEGGGGGGGIAGAIGGALGMVGDLLSKGAGFILDKLPGVGDLPDWLKGTGKYVLDKAGDWIKGKVSGLVGAGGADGPSGGGGAGSFDGRPVARWIIPILKWARDNGWGGSITSGIRTVEHNAAVGGAPGSNHLKTAYPGGAVDVGGWGARAEGQALAKVLAGYDGPRKLVWAGPTIGDWGHFSATGYAKGGQYGPVMGSYANGTDYVPRTGPYELHRGESVTPAGGNQALIASNDRLSATMERLMQTRHMDAVDALADHMGQRLGDDAQRRSQTGGNPNVTHRLY